MPAKRCDSRVFPLKLSSPPAATGPHFALISAPIEAPYGRGHRRRLVPWSPSPNRPQRRPSSRPRCNRPWGRHRSQHRLSRRCRKVPAGPADSPDRCWHTRTDCPCPPTNRTVAAPAYAGRPACYGFAYWVGRRGRCRPWWFCTLPSYSRPLVWSLGDLRLAPVGNSRQPWAQRKDGSSVPIAGSTRHGEVSWRLNTPSATMGQARPRQQSDRVKRRPPWSSARMIRPLRRRSSGRLDLLFSGSDRLQPPTRADLGG